MYVSNKAVADVPVEFVQGEEHGIRLFCSAGSLFCYLFCKVWLFLPGRTHERIIYENSYINKNNQDVPSDMRLENLVSADESILSFQDRQNNGASAFHLTQVPANKTSRFNKAFFIQLNPNLQLNQYKKNLLDSLDGKRCIIADNYVRHPGVHDFDMIPNPNLKHPITRDFRNDVHNKIYLCNYLFFALNKYRSAHDRERWYNYGRSAWSGSCYLSIAQMDRSQVLTPYIINHSNDILPSQVPFKNEHRNDFCTKINLLDIYTSEETCEESFYF
jgi:hypothetical protein